MVMDHHPAGGETPPPTGKAVVYLHVGTHKTGSSSLQKTMKRQKETFRRQGVEVRLEKNLQTGKWRGNSARLANLVLRDAVKTGLRMRLPEFQLSEKAKRHRLRLKARKLRFAPASKTLISAEGLCFARTDDELRSIRLLFPPEKVRLVPILVLRNEEDWRRSWRYQLQKNALVQAALAQQDPEIRIDADWYFDRQAIRAFWQKAGDVREVDYDQAMARDNDVLPSILRAMDLDPGNFTLGPKVNVSR